MSDNVRDLTERIVERHQEPDPATMRLSEALLEVEAALSSIEVEAALLVPAEDIKFAIRRARRVLRPMLERIREAGGR